MAAGAEEFFVVVGYQGEQLSHFLARLAESLAIQITALVNDDWDQGNGLSVLKAREVFHEPFCCSWRITFLIPTWFDH